MKTLQEALKEIKPAIGNNSEFSTCALLETHLSGSNEFFYMRIPVESLGHNLLLPYLEFFQVVGEDMQISETPIQIHIKTGKNQIAKLGKPNFPKYYDYLKSLSIFIDQMDIEDWIDLDESFMEAFAFCCVTTNKSSDFTSLFCINVREDRMSSTDGFRMSQAFVETNTLPFLLPNYTLSILKKLSVKQVKLVEGWILFKNEEDIILGVHEVQGRFPNTDEFFQEKYDQSFIVPQGLREFASTFEAVSKPDMDFGVDEIRLSLEFLDGELRCFGKTLKGQFARRFPIKGLGKYPTIQVNPFYFLSSVQDGLKVSVKPKSILFQTKNFSRILKTY